ncbi:DUF4062 domain-containing protein [Chryseotalea sanaruensis]|uniref:DUF4062 domain-containing protein n=1 Tax=Chryseotalea sanaruensis TaxID=2482724 RepID=A0A401U4N9_9BACT|nr:DUF4062 domain-containing protein [Chryseotalea sanaruensis]GCC49878.1 DUF4062 domain-containing protein [Chryseotalea sanaruensis]
MQIDVDVLIIFADNDNEPQKKKTSGWVSDFKRFLELMLMQVLGEKPNILLKSEFDTVTAPDMTNVGVLATVLSKDFIQSGRCLDNVETFYKAIQNSERKANRVFKVFKAPLSNQEQPPRLRELIGYEMYQIDTETGDTKEYTDYFSLEAERQYWMKMVDLAYDIFDSLMQLRAMGKGTEIRNIYKRKNIYLAETGHDLSVQRNIIKRELIRHGYIVMPQQTLPGTLGELEKVVKKDLEECSLSIHLIGSAYGEIPEGSERSIVDIQNRLSAERSSRAKQSDGEFSRLIWISPVIANASDRQKSFIESIKRDVEAQEGAEILQTPLEDFKNIMREELVESLERKGSGAELGKSVYLVHDRVDQQEVKALAEVIEKSGYKVLLPEFEGELLDLRKKHIDNLRSFDAAIIFKGKVNEQWVRMKVLDLLKAPGFGRKKPIMGKAIYTGDGTAINAESYRSQNIRVFQGEAQHSLENVKSFLKEF